MAVGRVENLIRPVAASVGLELTLAPGGLFLAQAGHYFQQKQRDPRCVIGALDRHQRAQNIRMAPLSGPARPGYYVTRV